MAAILPLPIAAMRSARLVAPLNWGRLANLGCDVFGTASSRRLARGVCLAVALGAAGFLGGCGDEVTAPEQAEEVPTDSTQSKKLANTDWLTVHDKISPARWLASREAGYDVELDAPRVKDLHKRLQDAKGVFGTPYRMTANRAVQLEEMIDEAGWEHEDAVDLIVTFTEVGESDTAGQGFGQVAQAYFQLRKSGLNRDEALQHIRDEGSRTEDPQTEGPQDEDKEDPEQ